MEARWGGRGCRAERPSGRQRALGRALGQPDSSIRLHAGQQRTCHRRWPETDFPGVELKMAKAQAERTRAEESGDPALRPHQEAAGKGPS